MSTTASKHMGLWRGHVGHVWLVWIDGYVGQVLPSGSIVDGVAVMDGDLRLLMASR